MNCQEFKNQIDEYLNNSVSAEVRAGMDAHARDCVTCAAELEIAGALTETAGLSDEIAPDRDLWVFIEAQIGASRGETPRVTRVFFGRRLNGKGLRRAGWVSAAVAASVAVALVATHQKKRPLLPQNAAAWEVAVLEGSPQLGDHHVSGTQPLPSGEWVRTDASSRVRLSGSEVGRVDVGPESSVRLLSVKEREHRIELAQGHVSAFIWAPPRLFFVETPAGVAEDLGCRYDLVIDPEGNGTLDVTLGFVSFERGADEVIVPAGSRCELRRGRGAGTPHTSDVSLEFRSLLEYLDFAETDASHVDALLAIASEDDAVTLWHLLPRVDDDARGRVFDRLASFVPLPDDVTREAILNLDRAALERWWIAIYPSWKTWN